MTGNKSNISQLSSMDITTGILNVIIETPKGSRNKYAYNEATGMFTLKGILPVGSSFPFDFGFLPSTLASDGDPLDIMLLMDEPAFPGCLVPSRLIGVIEAEQTEHSKVIRNDRLIAVAHKSILHKDINSLKDISKNLLMEIEHFFISYNSIKGQEFKILRENGPENAMALIQEGERLFRNNKSN
jgi:inorganic pyrophosphatase